MMKRDQAIGIRVLEMRPVSAVTCRLSQSGAADDDDEIDLPPTLSREERDLAVKRARNRSLSVHPHSLQPLETQALLWALPCLPLCVQN